MGGWVGKGGREGGGLFMDPPPTHTHMHTHTHSGNQMQNRGARCLSKALLTNCTLREVVWDHNDVALMGFQDVATSLEQ